MSSKFDRARLRIATPHITATPGRGHGKKPDGANRRQLLALLDEHGPLAPIELGERLAVSPGVISYHLAKLEKLGEVERTLRSGRLCYRHAQQPEVDARSDRPQAVALKLKTLQQLGQILEPRIAKVLREIEADYQQGRVSA